MLLAYLFCRVFTCALWCTFLFTVHKYLVLLRWFTSSVEYWLVYYEVSVCLLFRSALYYEDGLHVL